MSVFHSPPKSLLLRKCCQPSVCSLSFLNVNFLQFILICKRESRTFPSLSSSLMLIIALILPFPILWLPSLLLKLLSPSRLPVLSLRKLSIADLYTQDRSLFFPLSVSSSPMLIITIILPFPPLLLLLASTHFVLPHVYLFLLYVNFP